MTPETISALRRARLEPAEGWPVLTRPDDPDDPGRGWVVRVGSGELAGRVLVQGHSGGWRVAARVVLDLDRRAGFLLALDIAEERGVERLLGATLAFTRSRSAWTVEPTREALIAAVARALAESAGGA